MVKSLARRRGFTLIELLVVVAIIATLIAILLPSLAAAREQSRVSICLSNMRQIAMGCTTYIGDNSKDPTIIFSFPSGTAPLHATGAGYSYITEAITVGCIPDVTDSQMQASGSGVPSVVSCDMAWFTPKERPLNRYVTPDMSWDDIKRVGSAPARTQNPAVLPGVFKCPSDRTCKLPFAESSNGSTEDDTPFPSWQYWGTSFMSNWYWPYYYEKAPPGNAAPYGGSFSKIIAGSIVSPSYPTLGTKLIGNRQGRFSSEFIMLEEEQMDYALADAYPRGYSTGVAQPALVGWHKKVNYHIAAFLDGGARYKNFDTRYVEGPGWSVWPPHPWQGDWAQYDQY